MFFETFTFYHIFTIFNSGVCNIKKYFYTRHFAPLPYFKKKICPLHGRAFSNIPFLPKFYYFSRWAMCPIFQINTILLVTWQNINVFTQEALYPCFIWKSNCHSPSQSSSETSTFTLFSLFLTAKFTMFQINTDFRINHLKKMFLQKTPHTPHSIQRIFFFSTLHKFLETFIF